MERKKIVVIECISSAACYINDIRQAGYDPVVLEFDVPEDQKAMNRFIHDYYYTLNGGEIPEIVTCTKDYASVLKLVKELAPALVLAGGDEGLILATRIANELHLPCVPAEKLDVMRNKLTQQEVLKTAGLRAIESKVIDNLDDALAFMRQVDSESVVIKPITGGASIGVCICKTEEELKNALAYNLEICKRKNENTRILIQECIEGEEYSIDGVFCDGKYESTFLIHYTKKLVEGRGYIYDTAEYIPLDDEKYSEMVAFAQKVCEAIDLKRGCIHNEYKVDSKGTVLIEANCRPCGMMLKADYQDKILGFHETQLSLNSYVNPEKFADEMMHLPKMNAKGVVKSIIVPEEIYVKSTRFEEVARQLKTCSYYAVMGENRKYPPTIDLSTTGGMFYLAGKQEEIDADLEYLHDLEVNHMEQLYVME